MADEPLMKIWIAAQTVVSRPRMPARPWPFSSLSEGVPGVLAVGGGDAGALHQVRDFVAGPAAGDDLGQDVGLNLVQRLVRLAGVQVAQEPQADQQQRHEGQDQEEGEARREQAAVVLAEAREHLEQEVDPEDALEAVHQTPAL